MALYSIDNHGEHHKITHIPHQSEFDAWCSRLSPIQLRTIRIELQRMIAGDEIHTAGWMPGSDWTGTVWEPIYANACQYDTVAAGLCFGLFVWEAAMNHSDTWSFGRYEKDGMPIRSMTYFRIHLNS